MNLRPIINLALAVCVTASLALAALAVAQHQQAPGSMDMSMSDDMPCCPDRQKSKDCQDCPLVAMCNLTIAQAGPTPQAPLPLRHAIRTAHFIENDAAARGVDRPPPDHPPRSLS